MKLAPVLFAVLVGLVGCAAPLDPASKELQIWAPIAKADAKAGKIQWSTYYKEMFKRLEATNASNKPFLMEVTSTLIDAALAYEDGTLDQNKFESLQRDAAIADEKNTQGLAQQRQAAWAAAARNFANSQEKANQQYQQQLDKQKNCTTRWTGRAYETTCR